MSITRTRFLFHVVSVIGVTACILHSSAHADSTFSVPLPLNTTADADTSLDLDTVPAIASDGAGNMVAVWSAYNTADNGIGDDGDIFEAHSADGGQTWSDPAPLTVDDFADQSPVVATDGAGNWVAVWISDNTLGNMIGSDSDLLFSRSTNNGANWSSPTFLNSAAPTSNATDAEPVIVSGGPNQFIVAWYSGASLGTVFTNDFDIHGARSTDGGGSWKAEQLINPDGGSDAQKFDQTPGIASDGQGNWVAIWLGDGQDSVYDVLAARSTNDGKSWKDQITIGTGTGTPRIATDKKGHWVAVWHLLVSAKGLTVDADNDIVVVRSSDNGQSWSTQDFLNSNAEGDVYDDQKPTITTDGSGNWLATWTSTNPLDGTAAADFDIHKSISTDNGVTWTTPKQLHTNAATDLGSDTNSCVVTTGKDSWFAAWESYETFGGTLGSDADIVFARAFPSSYTITSPNGGESWKIGKKEKILWNSTAKAAKVKILLLKNGSVLQTIKNSTKDDGKQKWEVPAGVGTGSGFSVRIESTEDSSNADESDGTFKIKSGTKK